MDIPETCRQWETMLEAGNAEHKNVLRNVRDERCVPEGVAAGFFAAVASAPLPTSADEAYNKAVRAVRDQSAVLTCSRRAVPESAFQVLFRFEGADEGLQWRVPEVCASYGIKLERLRSLSDEDLELLTDGYSGPVNLGNRIGIVWTTDWVVAEPCVSRLRELADKLGLMLDDGASRIILCVYERARIARSLHVPSAIDAVNQPGFQVEPDCSAPCGKTRPISNPAAPGLPEAVHRECTVRPKVWSTRPL